MSPTREMNLGKKVVALGGGHGLAATLTALRQFTSEITAIVTVADNGGSSGRLRQEFPIMPPGDLRMALAALCGDDDWGRSWAEIMQYRFTSEGELNGHPVGNLLLAALWDRDGDTVAGLDRVGSLLKVIGRVLPMADQPLDIEATFEEDYEALKSIYRNDLLNDKNINDFFVKDVIKLLERLDKNPKKLMRINNILINEFRPFSKYNLIFPSSYIKNSK